MLTYTDPHPVSSEELRRYKSFALQVSGLAGKITLPFFRAGVAVENKLDDGRFDPVTEADKGAERLIRDEIAKTFPDHGVFGEEFGLEEGNGLTWVIDPIDGTRAFMTGMLHWGVLLALFNGAKPVLGVMHQPFTDEFFVGDGVSAEYHQGSEVRDLRVRGCENLSDAVLTTTGPQHYTVAEREDFARLEQAVKFTRYGGDCYIYAMLAMGSVDLAADSMLNPYDIQALIPIIRGAGGVVTTRSGGDPSMGGFVIASGSAEVHEAALRVLNEEPT